MADDDKKPSTRFAGWKVAVEKNDAAVGGAESVLRKAIALNPQMTGDLSEDEFIAKMASMQREAATQKASVMPAAAERPIDLIGTPAAALKQPTASTLVELIHALKSWVAAEHVRIDTERHALVEAEAQAVQLRASSVRETLAGLVDTIARLDPHMTSPKTQLVLSDESSFLKELGFKPDLVKERMRGAR